MISSALDIRKRNKSSGWGRGGIFQFGIAGQVEGFVVSKLPT
jgi:hypothetical protein